VNKYEAFIASRREPRAAPRKDNMFLGKIIGTASGWKMYMSAEDLRGNVIGGILTATTDTSLIIRGCQGFFGVYWDGCGLAYEGGLRQPEHDITEIYQGAVTP
jgi:hypothetical protein